MPGNCRTYWNPHKELMPQNELEDLQNKLLIEVLPAYYNSPIIKKLWDETGISPSDIQCLEDLSAAPVFRKDDVREYMLGKNMPFGGRLTNKLSNLSKRDSVITTTSGTTGVPTNLIYSGYDRKSMVEFSARNLWMAGLRPNDSLVNLNPARDVAHAVYQQASYQMNALPINMVHSVSEAQRLYHVIDHIEPRVVYAFSRPFYNEFDSVLSEQKENPEKFLDSVETLFWGGEPLLEEFKQNIEEEWSVQIYNVAGGQEPYWTCTECRVSDGWLHVPDDYFYVEIVDFESENRIGEDKRGELVITPLTYEAMAFPRWGHDDVAKMTRGKCDCGRTGTRIKVFGRTGDMVTIQGNHILPYDISSAVNDLQVMKNNLFQIYADSKESLRIKIGYDADIAADENSLEEMISDSISSHLNVPVEIVTMVPESELFEQGPQHKIPRVIT